MKYLIDPSLRYAPFKRLWDTIPSGGIEPREMCKMIYQLIKEKKIYVWYENNDFTISMEPPKGKVMVVKNNSIK